MVQGLPWKVASLICSRNSLLLWNPKFCHHNHTPLKLVLNQLNSVHTLTPYFCNINFNIVLPSVLMSPKCSLCFLIKILYTLITFPMHATCLIYSIPLGLITLIILKMKMWTYERNKSGNQENQVQVTLQLMVGQSIHTSWNKAS